MANKNVVGQTPGFLNTKYNYIGLHFPDTCILPVHGTKQTNRLTCTNNCEFSQCQGTGSLC